MRTRVYFNTVFLVILTMATMILFGCRDGEEQTRTLYPDSSAVVQQAADWVVSAYQNDDGGYTAFSRGANLDPSSVSGTVDAILALTVAGYDPAKVFPGEMAAPLSYLISNPDEVAAFATANGGQAGKLILALTAAGVDPRAFPDGGSASQDFVSVLSSQLEPEGTFGAPDPFTQSLAILGLAAAGEPVPTTAVEWLESQQMIRGSWSDGFGTDDSADATAMAIMALLAAKRERTDASIQLAIDFLTSAQLPAGWEYGPGLGANANSTALVIQALTALGEDFYTISSPWVKENQTPRQALLTYRSESGAFQADFGQGPFDDFFTTIQSIPAAAGCTLPLSAGPSFGCLSPVRTVEP